MNKRIKKVAFYAIFGFAVLGFFVQCKKNTDKLENQQQTQVDYNAIEQTPVSGRITLLVEESVFPIVEDVTTVFEHEYDRAKVDLQAKSEQEILQLIVNDSLRVAVLPRMLSDKELEYFSGRVTPKQTHFATDAIVFVVNKDYPDSIVDYEKIINNLKATQSIGDNKVTDFKSIEQKEPILIFDNYYSSVSKSFRELTGNTDFPKDYAYFLPSTQEVINYVNKSPNAIGVIGLNWLTQPSADIKAQLDNIKVLGVKNPKDGKYYKASQNNIATKDYPLTRDLYVIDVQGRNGLGLGFASYIAGYKGQRIVLKSGLVPFMTPTRELQVRKEL
ncbi:PstS family phosphate ABC transporter substrate-binding protein [Myroides sp. LJL119]